MSVPRRTWLVLVAVFVVSTILLSGCGSDQKGTDNGNEQQNVEDPQDAGASKASICDTVADVAKAEAAGDPAGMATALQLLVDDLPEDVADDVQAYIDGLEAPHPNQDQSPDSSENPEAEKAYRTYAEDTCGAGATSTGSGPSTTSTEPATTTTGPTTTAAGTDGSGTVGGTGTGGTDGSGSTGTGGGTDSTGMGG